MNGKLRTAMTAVLVAFVVASVAHLVWDGTRGRVSPTQNATAAHAARPVGGTDRTLVVYYFHGNTRCWTCRTIEALTKEAVETAFATELETGEVEMRVVNVEDPGNRHFVDDYQLATRSVVLVDLVGGREERWQRLDDVWRLVNDRASFIDYVVGNARGFLKGTS